MKLRSQRLVGTTSSPPNKKVKVKPATIADSSDSDIKVKNEELDDFKEFYDNDSPLTSFSSSPVAQEEIEVSKKISIKQKNNSSVTSSYFGSKLIVNSSKISKKRIKKEVSNSIDGLELQDKPDVKAKAKKSTSFKDSNLHNSAIPPNNWEETMQKIKKFRENNLAPVDSMGCERADKLDLSSKDFRFHVLISLMLSSQTRDEETYKAMNNLRGEAKGNVTAESLLAMDEDALHDCIRGVGFHNNKTKFLKKASQICLDLYDGDIPSTIKDLIALPGVGPKMAFLAMQCGWDKNVGIGVDVHVHRIANRLGWVKTKNPEDTRKSLESWLPTEWWKPINFLLVGFGQVVCYGNRPQCHSCPVAEACPSRDPRSTKPSSLRKSRSISATSDSLGKPKIILDADIIKDESSEKEGVQLKSPYF